MVIAALAARQHGIVSREQLLEAGLTRAAVRNRIAVRRLQRIHQGVYAAGSTPLTTHSRYMAALMACGDRAVISHQSAAALLGFGKPTSGPVHVTIPRGGSRRRTGITVHTTRTMMRSEVQWCEGIRCTTPARTLVDLAAVLGLAALRSTLREACYVRAFDRSALDAVLARLHGRRGTEPLRHLLADLVDDPPLTRSELERLFIDLVKAANLPEPVVNGYIGAHQVDFRWPDRRLVVETDGRQAHGHPVAFEQDRRRDLDLTAAGWHVIRLSWRQVVTEPARVAALLRSRLR